MKQILHKIAEIYALYGGNLYIVGGAVRDDLLGKKPVDVDICGDLPPETALAAFSALPGLALSAVYLRFSTLRLVMENHSFEYTSFRADSYRKGHRPEAVAFTQDIFADAQRRDFTIGCLYRHILRDELLDPTGYGQSDLQNGILRAVNGEKTLREDGLRLLRMARFAAELRFAPTSALLASARENAHLLRDITPARCRDEIVRILLADSKGGDVATGLRLLQNSGAWDALFAEISPDIPLCTQMPAVLDMRLAALFWPQNAALPTLPALCFSADICKNTADVFRFASLQGNALRLFAASHPRAAIIAAEIFANQGDARADGIRALLARNLPASERDLALSGPSLGLPEGRALGEKKRALWQYLVLHDDCQNTRESLLRIAENL